MNKTELISKYKHHLTLRNYCENMLRSYLNRLDVFIDYITLNEVKKNLQLSPKFYR